MGKRRHCKQKGGNFSKNYSQPLLSVGRIAERSRFRSASKYNEGQREKVKQIHTAFQKLERQLLIKSEFKFTYYEDSILQK